MAVFGPYTPVRKAGGFYFISGQVGVKPDKTADSEISGQTKQALDNLKALLKENDITMGEVVKTTVYLTDMDGFAAMNEVYEQEFPTPRPARATIAVKELPRVASNTELSVEIEAVAFKEQK